MAQELVIKIIGDATSLDRAMKKGARSAKTFDRSLRGTTLSVKGFHRSLTGLAAGLLGGVGIVAALRSVAHETAEMQKVAGQTNAVIASTGGIAGVTAEHVDELAKSLLNLSGVDDEVIKNSENLLLTFTNIRNVAGEGNDIFDQAALAALNLSTRFGRDLTGSAITLGKALQDPVRGLLALRRTGVQFDESQQKAIKSLVRSGRLLEAQKIILAEVEKQTRGSAKAYGDTLAGKLNKARENVLNLAGAMATTLLPAITPLIDKANAWLQSTENQQEVMRNFKAVVEVVGNVLSTLRDVFEKLNGITGSTKESLKLLLKAFILYKGLTIAAKLDGIASKMSFVGTEAKTATGQVKGLRGQLTKLRGIGAIEIFIIITASWELSKQIRKIPHWDDVFKKVGAKIFDAAPGLRRFFGSKEAESNVIPKGFREAIASFDVIPALLEAMKKAAKEAGGAAGRPGEVSPEIAAAERRSREAFRQLMQERAAFAVERAGATETLADDLAALNRYNALLKRRIRGGHATLELEREQFQVQQQIADVLKQQAEQRAEQRETRQFRILGFGPGGADLVPTAATLRKQLGSAERALQGTFLDTKKTRSLAARIRKVLSGAMGAISEDVRSTIKRLIDDLRGMQEKSRIDLDRWQTAGRGQFVFAATGASRPINVNVQIDGKTVAKATARHNENEMGKRHKQRSHSRRVR